MSIVHSDQQFFSHDHVARPLQIAGVGEGMKVLRVLANAFMQQAPEHRVHVPPSVTSGGGIAALASSYASLARLSRKLTSDEKAAGYQEQELLALPTYFLVRSDLMVSGVESDAVRQLLIGEVDNWELIGGPDCEVFPINYEKSSPVWPSVSGLFSRDEIAVESYKGRWAVTPQNAMELAMARRGSISYVPVDQPIDPVLRVLEVDDMQPTDPNYPFSSKLNLVWREPLTDHSALAFLEFARSKDAAILLRECGAHPL